MGISPEVFCRTVFRAFWLKESFGYTCSVALYCKYTKSSVRYLLGMHVYVNITNRSLT